ncbi:hypothetical protein JS530_03020 [Bifidobacterium sp. LC6]|uniref:Uncharacterized protein n=1 Tax=Bifidobacterium colobi TaxID=2809026 RepID=A0ABS5UTU8_9BIFI|nr:hypothetical protein [Bifidobacterium colobi]MBT1174489.1 hypothetical protein [Bifidobacterium colobi]
MGDFRLRTTGLDWSAVEQDADPVPGDCQSLYEAYLKCVTRSQTCNQVASFLSQVCGSHTHFKGESAEAFDVELKHTVNFAYTLADIYNSGASVFSTWAYALEDYQRIADNACNKAMEIKKSIDKYAKDVDSAYSSLHREQAKFRTAQRQLQTLQAQGKTSSDEEYSRQVRIRDDASDQVDRYTHTVKSCKDLIASAREDLDSEIKKVKHCKEDYDQNGSELAGN